ncbi:MAG TPA: cytochrome C oxidase subunit IV family protein [Thermoanaerobaculia bacterium]|nr:cytochrome C oxidase subunit IV family protein [Thermoanaerobaculia bacterium]
MIEGQTQAHPTLKTYFTIFAALMVLTGLTVWASFQHLGIWNTPMALGIAVAKATLVALFFMHLRYSPKLTSLVIASSLLWLVILFAITMSDYVSRSWLPIYSR